jgi:hypothetical protein
MIRKLKSGKWRLYSRKVNPRTGKRRNLGTFTSKQAALKHEREIQYFKRHRTRHPNSRLFIVKKKPQRCTPGPPCLARGSDTIPDGGT